MKINGFLSGNIFCADNIYHMRIVPVSSKTDKKITIKQWKMKKINKKNNQKINNHKKIHKNLKIFTFQKVNIDCKIDSNKMARIL